MSYCMVLVTCGAEQSATELATKIVEKKLASCVQLSPITSVYAWYGTIEKEPEIRLVMKTTTQRYPDLEAFILDNHDYEVPQIVRVPIEGGLPAYLDWIAENTA